MPTSLFDPRRLFFKAKTTRRWWIPLALLAVVSVNVAGLFRPEKFTATSLVLIRQPPITDQRVSETFRLTDMLDTIYVRITSYAFLSDIARKLNMDAGIQPDSERYDNLVKRMHNAIELKVNPDYFKVSYTGFTPQEAYGVTNLIVNQFILQSGEYYKEKARRNVEFLAAQLKSGIAEMKIAQEKILEYKALNIREIPEAQAEQMGRLARLQDEFQTTRQNLEATSNALRLAQREIVKVPETATLKVTQSNSSELIQLRSTQRDLKLKLEMLTQVQGYKDEHWDVIGLRKQLALIDDQIASATQSLSEETSSSPNPQYTKLRDMITDFQLKMVDLRKRLSEQHAEIARLETYLNTLPRHQDKLQTLDRDYKIAVTQVDYLRGQVLQAQKATELEAQGMGPSFDIKDPPRLPTRPSSPNRAKIAALSVFFGGAVAFGLIALFALLDHSIRSVEEAREALHMPVLGIVQRIVTPGQIARLRRRRLRRAFGFGTLMVLMVAAGIFGYFHYRENLLLGMDHMREFLKRW